MTLLLRRVLITAVVTILVAGAAIAAARSAAPPVPTPGAPLAAAPAVATSGAVTAGAAASGTATGGTADDAPGADPVADLHAVLAADQASPSTAVAGTDRLALRGALRRLAAWRKLVHATIVVDLPTRGLTTVQADHGTVAAVSSTSLTIAETGGGSITIALNGDTRVRRDGARAAVGDLKTGDEAFALSLVASGGAEAYLVVVPKG